MLDTWCGVVVLVKYNIEEKQLSDVIVIQLGFRDSALLYAIGIHIALMGFQKSRLKRYIILALKLANMSKTAVYQLQTHFCYTGIP